MNNKPLTRIKKHLVKDLPMAPISMRLPTVKEDAVIRDAAKADPDAQPLTRAQLKKMVPLRAETKLGM